MAIFSPAAFISLSVFTVMRLYSFFEADIVGI
jgi:hypothetical protein